MRYIYKQDFHLSNAFLTSNNTGTEQFKYLSSEKWHESNTNPQFNTLLCLECTNRRGTCKREL